MTTPHDNHTPDEPLSCVDAALDAVEHLGDHLTIMDDQIQYWQESYRYMEDRVSELSDGVTLLLGAIDGSGPMADRTTRLIEAAVAWAQANPGKVMVYIGGAKTRTHEIAYEINTKLEGTVQIARVVCVTGEGIPVMARMRVDAVFIDPTAWGMILAFRERVGAILGWRCPVNPGGGL